MEMMKKITLPPGVWTRVFVDQLVQSRSNQSGLRIHYSFEDMDPDPDTDLYFVMQEFETKPFPVNKAVGGKIYLMPDENIAVDVVML